MASDVDRTVRRARLNADDASVVGRQIDDLCVHPQVERPVTPSVLGEKIQKIPLRHEDQELAVGRQVREVAERDELIADLAADLFDLGVRAFQELVQQSELVHHFERRRVNRVAAKVAEEVAMFLEHDDVHAGAGEQIAEHHPGGAAAGNAASRARQARIGVHESRQRLIRLYQQA